MSEKNDTKLARPELRDKPTVILGGGPAGLTAGYLMAKQGLPVVVLEAENQVPGIAKTAVRDGYRFDLGGHRFFTKVQGGRRPLARDHERRSSSSARACRASTGATVTAPRSSSTTRCAAPT